MNRIEIENQLLYETRQLPIEKLQEVLVFIVKQRDEVCKVTKLAKRPIGLLDGKCNIHKDFKMTDEEFLQS